MAVLSFSAICKLTTSEATAKLQAHHVNAIFIPKRVNTNSILRSLVVKYFGKAVLRSLAYLLCPIPLSYATHVASPRSPSRHSRNTVHSSQTP